MIELPRRSVTRFFIPLIDVLTLLFCIFLLMPLVQAPEDDPGGSDKGLSAAERRELDRLRRESRQWQDVEKLREERERLAQLVKQLQQEKLETLQQRFVVRVLPMADDGRLFYYAPHREVERLVEITRDNVAEFIARQQRAAGKEVYFLLMYPRPATGIVAYPLRSQREEYDRWFKDVPHGYDIPPATP